MNPSYSRPQKYKGIQFLVARQLAAGHNYVTWEVAKYDGNKFYVPYYNEWEESGIPIKDEDLICWYPLPDVINNVNDYRTCSNDKCLIGINNG